jgi:hypothetical protein
MTPSSPSEPKHEIRAWVDESTYAALSARAAQQKISKSEVVRQVLNRHLGEANAAAASPWLESLLDAVLSKYFQGFPQTLDRLVAASYEQRSWAQSAYLRLLDVSGVKDPATQDQRVAALAEKVQAYAQTQADDFFQSLTAPEELIEPDEPTE